MNSRRQSGRGPGVESCACSAPRITDNGFTRHDAATGANERAMVQSSSDAERLVIAMAHERRMEGVSSHCRGR